MEKLPVIVVFAPTASGKTALMHELFSSSGSQFFFNGKAEIISADSMQVYKKLDIGTAKPDADFCREIPHHLIDIIDYKTQFNVSDFVYLADKKVKEILEKKKIPVMAGGTGFYIRSFLTGLPETPASDENTRNLLKKRIADEGNQVLFEELNKVDPVSAQKIHVNDSFRIVRALEIFYTTGKPRSSFENTNRFREGFNFLPIILEPDRDDLYKRISERVDIMFEMGLEQEIKNLKSMGAQVNDPGMSAIGYREWFLSDDVNEIKKMIVHNSCKYAKKQFTYIKDMMDKFTVIPYSGLNEQINHIGKIVENFVREDELLKTIFPLSNFPLD